ncbi:MAG TPA: DUF1990 domain-containing protein [Blastocatellia bacterium]|nr:DUF1990 domain-containing protein [Blastocatellia bacterium]
MFSFRKPSAEVIAAFLGRQRDHTFTYPSVGATRAGCAPAGYNYDHNRVCLGKGEATFAAACEAMRRWQMFRLGWVEVSRTDAPIAPGTEVAVMARCFGAWWVNACRIVYAIDEAGPVRKFGFAYGTLPDHVERGEERFTVEWHQADDSVWYDIYAFSRPAHWLARLGYPLARQLQKRFARDSKAAMVEAVRLSDKAVLTVR